MESNNMEDGGSYQLPNCCRRVGLLYDDRMCMHTTPDGEFHYENPNRILSIWNKLKSSDSIIDRCVVMNAKEAEEDHIALVHTTSHVNLIKDISSRKFDSQRNKIAARFNSIYFNEGSSESALLAAGSVIEVAEKVAKGELDSAFAIVRPPGHHAEEDEPMGFCLYNNVAIAASFLLDIKPELGIKKILIVDWDIHHGNGTQKMFWKDPRVLFFSVHRHDFGRFYPSGDDGFYTMTGEGPGVGYNINVPWENDIYGDADYLAVWDHVLIPVAEAFGPDLIIISAGFDAAINDPLGACCVSPYGYALMLSKLMKFAGGKIVMALEGGYNLTSIENSAHACLNVLLYDKLITGSPETHPFESTWRVIHAVRNELSAYWPPLAEKLPEKVLSSDSKDEIVTITSSLLENRKTYVENVIKPLLHLKIDGNTTVSSSWRSQLSKIDVWYATYGSNMRKSRFLCYIGGGQVKGMRTQCTGSVDKSPPKDIMWRTFPHRLFFARDCTTTWGAGGVAFLNPDSCNQDKAYICLYKITLEQFNDVLLQENSGNYDTGSSLFDLNNLAAIKSRKSLYVEALKGGWYRNVVYLGDEADIPILSMTCTTADLDSFKSGKFSVRPPGKCYVNTMVTGLVEGIQLSEDEAIAYIKDATTKALSGMNNPFTVKTTEIRQAESAARDKALRVNAPKPPGTMRYEHPAGKPKASSGTWGSSGVAAASKKRKKTPLPDLVEELTTPHLSMTRGEEPVIQRSVKEKAVDSSQEADLAGRPDKSLSGLELVKMIADMRPPAADDSAVSIVERAGQRMIQDCDALVSLAHQIEMLERGARASRKEAAKAQKRIEDLEAQVETERAAAKVTQAENKKLGSMATKQLKLAEAAGEEVGKLQSRIARMETEKDEAVEAARERHIEEYKESPAFAIDLETEAFPFYDKGRRSILRVVESRSPGLFTLRDQAEIMLTDPYGEQVRELHMLIPYADDELPFVQDGWKVDHPDSDWVPPALLEHSLDTELTALRMERAG